MGALHAGHVRLIELARRDCSSVTVTIFVNPMQFDRPDDLNRYPRPLSDDLDVCRRLGVASVFAPPVEEMYPSPPDCTVEVGRLGDHLCGRYRAGHFRGVATVVLKLFQIVQPDRAYFGEKDAQQLAIIRRMTTDFNIPIEVVGVPTVREDDGLALSSRNRLLAPAQRPLALTLIQALEEAKRLIAGGAREVSEIRTKAAAVVPRDASLKLEYLEIVNPVDLQPVEQVAEPVLVAGALWVGSVRLIDNLYCDPGSL
jgi:pantoate--beta-alanine ligase